MKAHAAALTHLGSAIVVSSALATGLCLGPDNGGGTVDLPAGCDYTAPLGPMLITAGMPAGTTIEVDPVLDTFQNIVRVAGGVFGVGGEIQTFDALLHIPMTGTGVLAGFNRNMIMPVAVEVHTAPRNPGDAVQNFDSELVSISGQIFGDPDFDVLALVGGNFFGLPGPGAVTLTRTGDPGSDFAVDSFFDLFYEFQFDGAAGSLLEDYQGARVEGPVRLQQGKPVGCPWDCGDGNNDVGVGDLLAMLGHWGMPGPCDYDGGGAGVTDLLKLLGHWGPCGGLHPACFPGSGNCFQAHATPGCDIAFCCVLICDMDPACCDLGWDQDCVQAAGVLCAVAP